MYKRSTPLRTQVRGEKLHLNSIRVSSAFGWPYTRESAGPGTRSCIDLSHIIAGLLKEDALERRERACSGAEGYPLFPTGADFFAI